MPDFLSYAQNAEDVVLWRALGHVTNGHYLEVGANDPRRLSVTRAFYDRGWSGLCIEPDPHFAKIFARERPRDEVRPVAVTDRDVTSIVLHIFEGTGLSTTIDQIAEGHADLGYETRDAVVEASRLDDLVERSTLANEEIHFAVVDTEGAEHEVLRSFDLERFRPWILVVESTAPLSAEQTHEAWEPLVVAAGYRFCLFDGVSRFYVDDRNHPELAEALGYPACSIDNFSRWEERSRVEELFVANRSLKQQLDARDEEVMLLRDHTHALEQTLSWRVTAPLRGLRRVLKPVQPRQ